MFTLHVRGWEQQFLLQPDRPHLGPVFIVDVQRSHNIESKVSRKKGCEWLGIKESKEEKQRYN